MLLLLARVLPLSWGRGLCAGLARLGGHLRPGDMAIARANLARAFPDRTAADRADILREATTQLGRNLFHTLAAPRLVARPGFVVAATPSPPADTPVVGTAGGDNALAVTLADLVARGRGVFILTGHIGCWELAGAWVAGQLAARGLGPLGVVTGTIHNPAVDGLVQRRRRELGLQPFPRAGGAAPLLRFLAAGGVVAVLQDQRTSVRNVAVPFFGHPAPTPAGMARLALRRGIPVLPIVGVWDEANRVQVMHHLPPLWPDEAGGETEAEFLTRCNAALETFIRRNPAQWVWFHRRWNPVP